jgi:hypothetical protein
MFTPALLTVLACSAVGLGKVYEDVAALPNLQYDFVVIGGTFL